MSDQQDLAALAVHVGETMRAAGLPAGPTRTARLSAALQLCPHDRTHAQLSARCIFPGSPEQVAIFDALCGGAVPDVAIGQPNATLPARQDPQDAGVAVRPGTPDGVEGPGATTSDSRTQPEQETPRAKRGRADGATASAQERLRHSSFAALGPAELAEVRRLARQIALATPTRRSHRYHAGLRGGRHDLRATLRAAARGTGDPARLMRRVRRDVPRQLVALCDVSGSMRPFAPVYLQLLQSAARGASAEVFTFATRLTRITKQLRMSTQDVAISRAVEAAHDWSGGTRIPSALREFNTRYGQRGMAREAVIVIVSDGREGVQPDVIEREMQRLRRLAHQIIWVNPRWAGSGMDALVGGMAAALPYCDDLVEGHSLASMDQLIAVLGGSRSAGPGRTARVL